MDNINLNFKDESEIPDKIYTDQSIYDKEIEVIFRGRHWNFVGLETEIPNAGDYRRSFVGPTPVVVVRARDGSINVFENRCSHRAVEFCQKSRGNNKTFVCPYHNWSFDLKGNLVGVPFKNGRDGLGGMPKSFRLEDHGLKCLFVTTYNGIIFASYASNMEPIEQYLGPEITECLDSIFKDKKIKIHSHNRHLIRSNWKTYFDNLKDPYHSTMLHSYLVVFGLVNMVNRSSMIVDSNHGCHGVIASSRQQQNYADIPQEFKDETGHSYFGMTLDDNDSMKYIEENNNGWTANIITVFPNMIAHRQLNGLGIRLVVPNGPNEFWVHWIMFGYEDDSPELSEQRRKHDNIMGPAGFVGMEDNEVLQFLQQGLNKSTMDQTIYKLDPDTQGTSNTLVSEAAIRSMYRYYKKVMNL
jgi:anthranilate 1,2-dioxygenase large subunit